MQNSPKDWLVRTGSREIRGPFTKAELYEELQKGTFTVDDEICPTKGHWVSAQGLATRDDDEHTLTSTRSQNAPRPLTSSGASAGAATNAAQAIAPEDNGEDLTPTPDFSRKPEASHDPRGIFSVVVNTPATATTAIRRRRFPVVLGATLVAFALWTVVVILRTPAPKNPLPVTNTDPRRQAGGVSLVQEIEEMIGRGETKKALKQLTQYHEQNASPTNTDYLIPYASLLIKEKESIPRAREILTALVANETITKEAKAKAHQWLGYAALAEGNGDMGEGHFLESLQLFPKNPAAHFNLGRAYLKQGKFLNALEYLQLAEMQIPDLWLIHIYKGRAKAFLKQPEDARKSFKSAIAASPERWLSYIYFSLFLTNLQEFDNAQANLERMLTRDPHHEIDNPPPFEYYQEEVNYAEYLKAFQKVMEKAPAERREYGRLYLNYLLHGGNSADIRKIETMAERGGVPLKLLNIQVKLDKDAPDEDLRKAILPLPQNLDAFGYYAYVLRGRSEMKYGAVSEAKRDLYAALMLEPKSAVTYFQLFKLAQLTNRPADAENAIKTLLIYHPRYIPAILLPH